MSRFLLSAFSNARVVRPYNQLRMKSSSGKKCREAPGNTCEPAIGPPKSTPVCTTKKCATGRTDAELKKCLDENIANPLPACTTPMIASFPCQTHPHPPARGKVETFEGKSAWEKPECCLKETCELPLRHDVLYLEPTHKCGRRTWYDWAALCEANEIKCEPEKLDVDPPEYRERIIPPPQPMPPSCKYDLCEPEPPRPSGQINKAATADQPGVKIDPCPRIRLPGCKRAAEKLKCSPPVAPSCCQKRCTQYPAYSECCRKDPAPPKDSECGCVRALSQCKAFNRAQWLLEN